MVKELVLLSTSGTTGNSKSNKTFATQKNSLLLCRFLITWGYLQITSEYLKIVSEYLKIVPEYLKIVPEYLKIVPEY